MLKTFIWHSLRLVDNVLEADALLNASLTSCACVLSEQDLLQGV